MTTVLIMANVAGPGSNPACNNSIPTINEEVVMMATIVTYSMENDYAN